MKRKGTRRPKPGASGPNSYEEGRSGHYLSLGQRLVALLLYLPLIYLAHWTITGRASVDLSGRDLWIVSAIGFLAYSLLEAPFFVPPRQAFASALTAGLILLAVNLPEAEGFTTALATIRWAAVVVTGLVLATSGVAIIKNALGRPAPAAYQLSKSLGTGAILFSAPALISIMGFHHHSPGEILLLASTWLALILVRPIELVWLTTKQVVFRKRTQHSLHFVGTIERIDSPNILRVALSSPEAWTRNSVHIACLPDARQVYVIALARQNRDTGILGTGFIQADVESTIEAPQLSTVYAAQGSPEHTDLLRTVSGIGDDEEAPLVGFIVEDSRIGEIRMEVSSEIELQEGTLVFCNSRESRIYYQILDARTTEESFDNNPLGTHRAIASQLGTLSIEGTFSKFPWLPEMNSPVFLANDLARHESSGNRDEFLVGTVPGTNLSVGARFSDLLAYHTAILGVTGTGKTEFVYEIIRHGLGLGAKVFCVDLTEEYRVRLADNQPETLGLPSEDLEQLEELIFGVETGDYSAAKEKAELDQWVRETRPSIESTVDDFLRPPSASLGIFELPEIANTRATLRATELYLSAIFEWARKHRRSRQILVVLEEAHTVAPEFTMFNRDRGDTNAVVGRIAQIALQGRKYGVGLVLISQRTALVSKTLLSQCNTCFAFAMYDKTGLDYLKSVYGEKHVAAIPNLGFLRGVAIGKAITSDRPIVFEIPYDESKRLASEELDAGELDERDPTNREPQDTDDDIPF